MEINMERLIEYLCSVKGRIELLWSFMGGLLFSMFANIQPDRSWDTGRWLSFFEESELYNKWDGIGRNDFLDEFILGFIFTFILVKSIEKYNSQK
jgi:hypothetical protein